MSIDPVRVSLRTLTVQALENVARSEFGVSGCSNAVAYYDSRKDELVTSCVAFNEAVTIVAGIPEVIQYYGADEAVRITLQFVFIACGHVDKGADAETAFETTFQAFMREASRDHWIYRSITNVQNFESPELPLALEDGLSFHVRSSQELADLLGWGREEFKYLFDDMRHGAFGSTVLLVESRVPKKPDNFLLTDDATQHQRAARLLLAMRLTKPGEVRIGRMFAARPVEFNLGMGGLTMYGFSYWYPGPSYVLAREDIPLISRTYRDLSALEKRPLKEGRNLRLSLRAFASIYDRQLHQADDRIVDAITALEALWKLEVELAFRLAFRTATLLATC